MPLSLELEKRKKGKVKERKKGFLSIEQPNLRTPTFQKLSYLGNQKRKWKKERKFGLTTSSCFSCVA
jgi:hypothetical protein